MRKRSDSDPDPRRIRSVAVHREDVANALEATLRSDRVVVLRVTPPYSGRMRARLHRVGTEDETRTDAVESRGKADHVTGTVANGPSTASGASVHLDPRDLVERLPAYPEVDDTTADRPDAGLAERRERHAAAVETWRERVREAVGGTVVIPVADDSDVDGTDGAVESRIEGHEIDVVALG